MLEMSSTEVFFKNIASPYNIYLAQISNSFQAVSELKQTMKINEGNFLNENILKLLESFKTYLIGRFFFENLQILDTNDLVIRSKLFLNTVDIFHEEFNKYIHEERDVLDKDIYDVCIGMLKFIEIFRDLDSLTIEKYEYNLDTFEQILDKINAEENSKSVNSELKRHVSDIFFSFYGIIESLNVDITQIKWSDILLNKEVMISEMVSINPHLQKPI